MANNFYYLGNTCIMKSLGQKVSIIGVRLTK